MAPRSGYQVRAVRSADDRKLGGDFLTLKQGESFEGYALFVPDPAAEDNGGYFEYFEHYSKATGYVACAGPDDCPFCKVGDRPNTRAKAVFLIDDKPTVFNLNYKLINEFYDYLSDDEPVKGQLWRVKRLDDRGGYNVRLKPGKLTQKDLKAAMTNVPDVEQIVVSRMRKSLEEMDASVALRDDDDENGASASDPDETTSRKGRPASSGKNGKGKAAPEPEADDPIEDETVTITSVSKANNTLKVDRDGEETLLYGTGDIDVSRFKKGNEVVVSAEKDNDDDWVLSSLEAADAEPAPAEGEAFEDTSAEVLKVTKNNKTAEVAIEGQSNETIWFTSDEDFAYAVKGETIVFSAEKDGDGDWVVSSVRPAEDGDENEDGMTDASDLPKRIERETLTVVSIDQQEETMVLEGEVGGDNLKFALYFLKEGEAADVDFDDYEEGMEIVVTAFKDGEGDMVADEHVPEKPESKSAKGATKGAAKRKG